jgi:hypothetical protein
MKKPLVSGAEILELLLIGTVLIGSLQRDRSSPPTMDRQRRHLRLKEANDARLSQMQRIRAVQVRLQRKQRLKPATI